MAKNNRVLLHDESGYAPLGTSKMTQKFLTSAWSIGTQVFPGKSVGASSWDEALRDLVAHQEKTGKSVRELHVWGHGSRGRPMLGPIYSLDLIELAAVLSEVEIIWWRSCSVHADLNFAERVADITGATSVGHCVAISAPNPFVQRAVCAVEPGQVPHWHKGKVKKKGHFWKDEEGRPLPSVSTLRARVPFNMEGMWSKATLAER